MLAKRSPNKKLVKKPKNVASTKVSKQVKSSKSAEKSSPKLKDSKRVDKGVKKLLKKSLEKPPTKLTTKTKKIKIAKVPKDDVKSSKKSKRILKSKQKKSVIKDDELDKLKEIREEFSGQIEKSRIQPETIQTAIDGVIKSTTTNPKLKTQLFNEQFGIFLQINSFHISNQFPKILRIPLRNSILTQNSEICLIVPDVKGILNKEHDKHLEHYEELLCKHGIKDMFKKLMTFHEFRTEYETFEMKNRLANLYDVFLVDGRISGKVVNKCGKIFYKYRKVPTPIRLNVSKLKDHINKTLDKTQFYIHNKGNSFIVQFGHNEMSTRSLIENAYCILERLDKEFPGGFGNVQNINVYTHRGLKIPIYKSLKKRNEVVLPKKTINRPKWSRTVRGELSTALNKEVIVTPTGTVKVIERRPRFNRRKVQQQQYNEVKTGQIKQKSDDQVNKKKIVKVKTGQIKRKSDDQVNEKKIVKVKTGQIKRKSDDHQVNKIKIMKKLKK